MIKGVDFTGITTLFCCHDKNGKILMNKRSKNCRDEQGTWELGAGSLEYGLSPEENLKKEIKEEYGLEIEEFKFLGTRNIQRKLADGTPTHWIAFDYLVPVDKNKVINGEPESIDEMGWFTLENLPTPLHSTMLSFIKTYEDQIKKALTQKF